MGTVFMTATVLTEQKIYYIDKPYTYLVPDNLNGSLEIGSRVIVPFGNGNRRTKGVIISFSKVLEKGRNKYILSLADDKYIFTDEMIKLSLWLKEHTFCNYFDAFKLMIPSGLNYKIKANYCICDNVGEDDVNKLTGLEKDIAECLFNNSLTLNDEKIAEIFAGTDTSSYLKSLCSKGILYCTDYAKQNINDAVSKNVRLTENELPQKLTTKQKTVTELLEEIGDCSIKEICYFTGVTSAVITNLANKGIVEIYNREVFRRPYEVEEDGKRDIIELNNEQQVAFKTLLKKFNSEKAECALLYGVTGSGKTQVFMKMVDKAVDEGKGVIVMVPEIALTPQTLDHFHKRYGSKVAVFHSAMSQGQRMDEWKRIKNGAAQIAIGTRSAVFAPLKNLGLIIMDEEQEGTYKSEKSPRYHARDVAKFRCAYNNALLVLASATPSVETFSAAKQGRYTLVRLEHRYGNAVLPKVIPVDMRTEMMSGNVTSLSKTLYEYLENTLSEKHQAILLLNRRGYNTFVSCPSCGYVVTCKNCSISMTYHSANNRLMCHYCGESVPYSNKCPNCSSEKMRYSGFGTQRAEQEISSLFPKAKVLRMDADSTMSRVQYEEKLSAFKEGKFDIMIGTQMVAKGLDFKNVTLVGVIGADQSMYSDDFRSYEKTFSLLTQVIGRSGRGDDSGVAVVQTINPQNAVIQLASKQNYDEFYNSEILIRKMMTYPPYCDMTVIGVSALGRQIAECCANDIAVKIRGKADNIKLIMLGPSPASIVKVNNKYRYRIILKVKNTKDFRKMISEVLSETGSVGKNKDVSVFVDINPQSIV